MKEKYVIVISWNGFPQQGAASFREDAFSHIYEDLGYRVYHIVRGSARRFGHRRRMAYVSANLEGNSWKKLQNYFRFRDKVEWITKRLIRKHGYPSLIQTVGQYPITIALVKQIAMEHGVKIVHDQGEWYSACEFTLGCFDYAYVLCQYATRFAVRKPYSVTVVSRYLEAHYRSLGLRTLRIPALMNIGEYGYIPRHDIGKIVLVYAGSPAKKDYLWMIVESFMRLDRKIRHRFVFHIYGVEHSYIKSDIPDEMIVHGHVGRKEVLLQLQRSDFSLLLRPSEERYTKAGFPSKVAEAMMCGCAMLCNYSSDLELYLQNNYNACICDECSSASMQKTLEKISEYPHEKLSNMKKNARITGETYFDYRRYIESVRKFLSL